MTTIKIYKDFYKEKIRADVWGREKAIKNHDQLVLRTISRMRKLGMVMIIYNEASYKNYTIMKFEKKVKV